MTKNVANSRKKSAEDTKNKIYQSAEKLFAQYGFDSVNVDDIVTDAGVAKGSFYVHFKTKDTLIAEIIKDYVIKADFDYQTYLESLSQDVPVEEIMIKLVEKIAEVLIDTIGYENMKNLYKVQITRDIDAKAVMDYNRNLYTLFQGVIEKGIAQNIFINELTAQDITKHMILAYRGLTYEWCIRYPEFDLKTEAKKHFKILISGIMSKEK